MENILLNNIEQLYKKDIILHIFKEVRFDVKCPIHVLVGGNYNSIVCTDLGARDMLNAAKIINRMIRKYGYLPTWDTSTVDDKKFRTVRIK